MADFDDPSSQMPRYGKLRASKGFIATVVTLAAFTDSFLYGLVVPVTPTALEQRIGIPEKDLQKWVSILMALDAFAWLFTSPVAGYIADRVESRRMPLLAGLPALLVSAGLLYVGDSLTLWALGRLLQGVSAAVTSTVGLALLVDTIDKDRLGETLGYMSMGMMVGTTSGPLLGGIIYEAGGYHSVFGSVFVLIAIDTVLRLAMIERKHAGPWLDAPDDGSAEPLLCSPTQEDTPSYGATGITSNEETGEEHTSKPQRAAIIVLLSIPKILLGLWSYFIVSIAFTSFDSSLPLFVRDTFGWHQLGQGLIFLPISITQVFDPIVGSICDKFPKSRRYIVSIAFIGAAAAFFSLRIVTHDSFAQKVWLCGLLLLLGLSLSFVISPILLSIDEALEDKEKESPGSFGKGGAVALAYGLVNSAFAAGALMGPFVGGYVRSIAGWDTMTFVLGTINVVTGVAMWVLTR